MKELIVKIEDVLSVRVWKGLFPDVPTLVISVEEKHYHPEDLYG